MADSIPSTHEPAWADTSEEGVAVIDGRTRDVVDHYGVVTSIRFPGRPSQEDAALPLLDILVSRCDVVDETDSSRMRPGPYLLTVGAADNADSTLTSITDLEQFAMRVLTAAETVRTFLAAATTDTVNQENQP